MADSSSETKKMTQYFKTEIKPPDLERNKYRDVPITGDTLHLKTVKYEFDKKFDKKSYGKFQRIEYTAIVDESALQQSEESNKSK